MKVEIKNDMSRIEEKNIQDLMFEIRNFVQYENPVLNPFDLDNMLEGIGLLYKHIENNNNIFIQVDSDVDGLTSAVLTYLAIKKLSPNAKVSYRLHPDKTHGIKMGTIPEDTDLLIMPDASSNEFDKHKYYKDKGMDILVLDHHHAEKYSEYACVINNQLSEKYMNKDLSGVGVVAKFFEAYRANYGAKNVLDGLYDLVAVGLIADSMNINNSESLHYINKGLNNITQPMLLEIGRNNYYIKEPSTLTAKDISYSVAPLFNAVFRAGKERDKELMFKAFIEPDLEVDNKSRSADPGETINICTESLRLCNNARSRQNRAILKSLKYMEDNSKIVVRDNVVVALTSEEYMAREYSGLVAMKIAAKHGKPTLVLMEDRAGNYSGSGRNIDDAISFKDFIGDSDIAIFAEGHDSAFGVSFDEMMDINRFMDYCDDNYADFDSTIVVDFKINMSDINLELAKQIDELNQYYGKGFESPSFFIENFELPRNVEIIGKAHDTIKAEYGDMEIIRFKDPGLAERIESTKKTLVLDIIGSIEVNEWAGSEKAQLVIKQYDIKEEKFSF